MKVIMVLLILMAIPSEAYRFLCNSINADGVAETDSCGICDDTTATRWDNQSVSYAVGTSQLPSGITVEDWVSLVNNSFASWAGAAGVNLITNNTGEAARSFGTDSVNHDIFWVDNSAEWLELVGVAPNGVLGVTLPPYLCPSGSTEFREIVDADLIMNGTPEGDFAWKLDCNSLLPNCQSMKATVTHELGHFLGLGHDCVGCSDLMAAVASFLVTDPQQDDLVGIRALYPNSSEGAFTAACSTNSVCDSNICHSNGYCTLSCTQDADCGTTLRCSSSTSQCEFAATATVGLKGECSSQLSCEEGLQCIGITSSGSSHCFNACTQGSGTCSGNETCRQLKNNAGEKIDSFACIEIKQFGETCGAHIACDSDKQLKCTNAVCANGVAKTAAPVGSGGCSQVGIPQLFVFLGFLGLLIRVPRRRKKC
ncbi:MAG: matrixin family metalloprotease [Deltaproteobacteria bacterium]|nr:matrixin family metalloprotease [Deltaproteobacteria bacterium]